MMNITFDMTDNGTLTFRVELQGVIHEVRATDYNDPFTQLGLSAIEVAVGAIESTVTFISEPAGHILKLCACPDGMMDCELIWVDELIAANAITQTKHIGKDRIHPYDYAKMILDILLDVGERIGVDRYEELMTPCHYPYAIVSRLYDKLDIDWREYDKERRRKRSKSAGTQ